MNDSPKTSNENEEIERRIVSMVAGELPPDEREELGRLIAGKSDLMDFKRDIERVEKLLHHLTSRIGNSENNDAVGNPDSWTMNPVLREALLSQLRGSNLDSPPVRLRFNAETRTTSHAPRWLENLAKIAAVLLVAGFFGNMVFSLLKGSHSLAMVENPAGKHAESLEREFEIALDEGGFEGVDLQGGTDLRYDESQDASLPTANAQAIEPRSRVNRRLEQRSSSGEAKNRPSRLDRRDFDQDFGDSLGKRLHFDDQMAQVQLPVKPQSPVPSNLTDRSLSIGNEADNDLDGIVDGIVDAKDFGFRELGRSGSNSFGRDGKILDRSAGQLNFPQSGRMDLAAGGRFVMPQNAEEPASEIFADGPMEGKNLRDEFGGAMAGGLGFQRSKESGNDESKKSEKMVETEHLLKNRRQYFVPNSPELIASESPMSTFSLNVSDVSFKLAQASLSNGLWPDASQIRIEDFVNALDYGDPMPSQSDKVACRVEQAIHPSMQQRNILRISMRTAAEGRSASTPLRLTFLLDNSGSMERLDRRQTVHSAFKTLAQQLGELDQATLISFARKPHLLADQVNGTESQTLVDLVENLPSEGGTNIEAALQLAFEKSLEQNLIGAQNRVVLLTDGAVNLGDADPESLSNIVTTMRNNNISFDAAGIGADGLNDEVLEALTRQGDGRYYLLDSSDAVDGGFAKQIAGALRPSAKNVKVQVEFNPQRVGRYQLLGFEKHRLSDEDFRNDKVDAAELAGAETGVAVYQFEPFADGQGDVGSISIRFDDLSTQQMVEHRWPILYQTEVPRLNEAESSMRLAWAAAMLAGKLRGDAVSQSVQWPLLTELMAGLPEHIRQNPRVEQLTTMIEQSRQLSPQ